MSKPTYWKSGGYRDRPLPLDVRMYDVAWSINMNDDTAAWNNLWDIARIVTAQHFKEGPKEDDEEEEEEQAQPAT